MTVRKKLLIPVVTQAFVVVLVLGLTTWGGEHFTHQSRGEYEAY